VSLLLPTIKTPRVQPPHCGGSWGSHNPIVLIPTTTSLSCSIVIVLGGDSISRSWYLRHPMYILHTVQKCESLVEINSKNQWWTSISVCQMRPTRSFRASSVLVLLECMDVLRTSSDGVVQSNHYIRLKLGSFQRQPLHCLVAKGTPLV
jgi:hypothetical protein